MSQESIPTSPTTTGPNLTSKFLRKAKFRTVSATHTDEGDFVPGLSKPPDVAEDANTQIQSPAIDSSTTLINQEGIKQEPSELKAGGSDTTPRESDEVEENPTISDSKTLPPKLETVSPSLSPKLETQSPSLTSKAYRTTTPEPSITDVTNSIMSSPRGSSTETEILPPVPKEDSPMDNFISFSPEDLEQAKNLVLDLLGWGVDPEYLVNSGVSPPMIFRVFTDLNLSLPSNLEVSKEVIAAAYSWGPDFAQSVD